MQHFRLNEFHRTTLSWLFHLPEEGEEGEYLSPMQILEYLHTKAREIKLTGSSANTFGRTLRKLELEHKKTNKGILYRVARK